MTRADRHRLNLIRTYISQPFVFAASKGVAALVSWLIYECSDTVEQRMILGGSNERLTDVNIHDCYICSTLRFPQGSPACILV